MIHPVGSLTCENSRLASSSNGRAPPTLVWQRATSLLVSYGPTSTPVIAHFSVNQVSPRFVYDVYDGKFDEGGTFRDGR